MEIPEYCATGKGNCKMCSLSNYGRDCYNAPIDVEEADPRTPDERGRDEDNQDYQDTINDILTSMHPF